MSCPHCYRFAGSETTSLERAVFPAETTLFSPEGGGGILQGVALPESEKRHEQDRSHALAYAAWFAAGFVNAWGWVVISFSADFWVARFGSGVWIQMLLCYSLPALPFLLSAVVFDERLDRSLGSENAFFSRGSVLFGLMAMAAVLAGGATESQTALLAICLAMGVSAALGTAAVFAQSAALSTSQPCAVAFVCLGGGAATLFMLAQTVVFVLVGINEEATPWVYFGTCGAEALALAVFYLAVLKTDMVGALRHYDVALLAKGAKAGDESEVGLLAASDDEEDEENELENALLLGSPKRRSMQKKEKKKQKKKENKGGVAAVNSQVALPSLSIAVCCMSLSIGSGLLSVIPSQSKIFGALVLYTASLSVFAGAQVALLVPGAVATAKALVVANMARLVVVLPALFYLVVSPLSDYAVFAVIAFSAFTAGYLNSRAYAVAAGLVGETDRGLATTLLNVWLYAGVYLGLGIAFALPLVVTPGSYD